MAPAHRRQPPIEISVIIPTYQRGLKLASCLSHLSRQTLRHDRYEVLVGLDGPDPASSAIAQNLANHWPRRAGTEPNLRVIECPRSGLTKVRNTLLTHARGRIILSTNDDTLADPGLLEAHVRMHDHATRALRKPVVVVGASPWVQHEPDNLFAQLTRETSMVFFYDRMDAANAPQDPLHDWGFRHSWGLNMSAPREASEAVGHFTEFPEWYGFEDNEWAHKLRNTFGSPTLYARDAKLYHDHAMTPAEYLHREYKLGRAALGFALTSPACALEMFRRDLTSRTEQNSCASFVKAHTPLARTLYPWFLSLGTRAPITAPTDLKALYTDHMPLKRWAFRKGLLDAFEARATYRNAATPQAPIDPRRGLQPLAA